ncbi:sensor histidine kinase, partial [Bradyrhizobium neotropicale]
PAAIGAGLYRIVQEALTNAAKHADATRVSLELTACEAASTGGRAIALCIADDGRPGDAAVKSGMGLLGMRERVAALGGRLSFETGPDRGGTLRVVIPAPVDPIAMEHAA